MKIYIIGPMRSIPFYNRDAFRKAQESLEAAGHEVINPILEAERAGLDTNDAGPDGNWQHFAIGGEGTALTALAKTCANQLLSCEGYHTLDGFYGSRGARAEYAMSIFAGLTRVDETGAEYNPPEPITEEATKLTHAHRIGDYGHPRDDFGRTAKMWEMVLGIKIEPWQVGMCMMAVKFSRACNKPKRDNLVDFAGYAETVARVLEDR